MKVLWVRRKKRKGVDLESQKRKKKMVRSLGRGDRSQKEGAWQRPQCRAWKEARDTVGAMGGRVGGGAGEGVGVQEGVWGAGEGGGSGVGTRGGD